MNELLELLRTPLSERELEKMMPEEALHEPDPYTQLLNCFTQRNTEALVKCKDSIKCSVKLLLNVRIQSNVR